MLFLVAQLNIFYLERMMPPSSWQTLTQRVYFTELTPPWIPWMPFSTGYVRINYL